MVTKHILVADDDSSNLLYVRRSLEKGGYTDSADYKIITASDGHEAISQIQGKERRGELNLVVAIVDVVMPRCDGQQLMNWLRNKQIAAPIIMMTGAPLPLSGKSEMPDHILEKPFGETDLCSLVSACIRQLTEVPAVPYISSAACA